jgi:hypothetical protein
MSEFKTTIRVNGNELGCAVVSSVKILPEQDRGGAVLRTTYSCSMAGPELGAALGVGLPLADLLPVRFEVFVGGTAVAGAETLLGNGELQEGNTFELSIETAVELMMGRNVPRNWGSVAFCGAAIVAAIRELPGREAWNRCAAEEQKQGKEADRG